MPANSSSGFESTQLCSTHITFVYYKLSCPLPTNVTTISTDILVNKMNICTREGVWGFVENEILCRLEATLCPPHNLQRFFELIEGFPYTSQVSMATFYLGPFTPALIHAVPQYFYQRLHYTRFSSPSFDSKSKI